jgi:hypothetical protein
MRWSTAVRRGQGGWRRKGRRPRSDPSWPRERLAEHHDRAELPRSRDRRRLGAGQARHSRRGPSIPPGPDARPCERTVWLALSGPVAPPPRIRRCRGPDGGRHGVHRRRRAGERPVARSGPRRGTEPRHRGAASRSKRTSRFTCQNEINSAVSAETTSHARERRPRAEIARRDSRPGT